VCLAKAHVRYPCSHHTAPDVLRRGISVTLETKACAVEGQIFVRHSTDRGLVAHEALELRSYVCSAVLVPVEEKEFAVSLCATPQPPYLFIFLQREQTCAKAAVPFCRSAPSLLPPIRIRHHVTTSNVWQWASTRRRWGGGSRDATFLCQGKLL
jgi:hypothetical protein